MNLSFFHNEDFTTPYFPSKMHQKIESFFKRSVFKIIFVKFANFRENILRAQGDFSGLLLRMQVV